jgi:glycosyltransferase involved in cell wall biosynthesis
MRILLTAFTCAPNQGSERGLGWNWAMETARQGHEVTVLTQIELRPEIEAEVDAGRVPANLTFEFFMPGWLDRFRSEGIKRFESLTLHLTHLMWQLLAYRHVRDNLDLARFDVIHHLTYSGIRHPTIMGRLPLPLILGPLGGGERAPYALRKGLPWGGWLKDAIRDVHTFLIRFDPITRRACADAVAIYVKTEESRQAIPAAHRQKAHIHMEIGTRGEIPPAKPPHDPKTPLKILYAGRLIYWKGMHLGLRAFAEARKRGLDARLTMLGQGPDESFWRGLAEEQGIDPDIDWLAWVEHSRIGELYRAHDLVLFPSLHDSSGNVVLESLFNGLPVVCLDLGGPAVLVTNDCGRVVDTDGRSEAETVSALAEALLELSAENGPLDALSAGARARAEALQWPKLVASFYDDAEKRLRAAGKVTGPDPAAPGLAADRT